MEELIRKVTMILTDFGFKINSHFDNHLLIKNDKDRWNENHPNYIHNEDLYVDLIFENEQDVQLICSSDLLQINSNASTKTLFCIVSPNRLLQLLGEVGKALDI